MSISNLFVFKIIEITDDSPRVRILFYGTAQYGVIFKSGLSKFLCGVEGKNKDEMNPLLRKAVKEALWEYRINMNSNQNVTIHRLWPAFIRINKLMEYNISDSMIIRNMKSNGRAYIASIYDDFSPTMEHKIGVFLHPMLKGLPIATNSEKEEIYSAVRLLFENERADCELMSQNIDQSVCNEYEVVNENSLFIDFITEQLPMEMTDDELQRYIDFRFQNVIRIVFYLYV